MMKLIKKSLYKITPVIFLFSAPVFMLYADTHVPIGIQGKLANPIDIYTINDFIRILLEGVLKIGIPIVALAVIYCGFLFVAARGNSEKLTKAKDALLYTLIGAAILLGSWAIAKLIHATVVAL